MLFIQTTSGLLINADKIVYLYFEDQAILAHVANASEGDPMILEIEKNLSEEDGNLLAYCVASYIANHKSIGIVEYRHIKSRSWDLFDAMVKDRQKETTGCCS